MRTVVIMIFGKMAFFVMLCDNVDNEDTFDDDAVTNVDGTIAPSLSLIPS